MQKRLSLPCVIRVKLRTLPMWLLLVCQHIGRNSVTHKYRNRVLTGNCLRRCLGHPHSVVGLGLTGATHSLVLWNRPSRLVRVPAQGAEASTLRQAVGRLCAQHGARRAISVVWKITFLVCASIAPGLHIMCREKTFDIGWGQCGHVVLDCSYHVQSG